MDWQVVVSLLICAGAFVAYFLMGEAPRPKPPSERRIHGNDAWKPGPAPQVDAEVIDRFSKALKAEFRPTA